MNIIYYVTWAKKVLPSYSIAFTQRALQVIFIRLTKSQKCPANGFLSLSFSRCNLFSFCNPLLSYPAIYFRQFVVPFISRRFDLIKLIYFFFSAFKESKNVTCFNILQSIWMYLPVFWKWQASKMRFIMYTNLRCISLFIISFILRRFVTKMDNL